MLRSLGSDSVTLTTLSNRYALPCWPRKFCHLLVATARTHNVWRRTDSAEDVIVVGQMRLAVLASVDARRVEIDIVREPHGDMQVIRLARGSLVDSRWLREAFAWAFGAGGHTYCLLLVTWSDGYTCTGLGQELVCKAYGGVSLSRLLSHSDGALRGESVEQEPGSGSWSCQCVCGGTRHVQLDNAG